MSLLTSLRQVCLCFFRAIYLSPFHVSQQAVGVSLIAPQSVTEKYPELQESIDSVQASICPINWLCIFFPWLCWPWFPWVFYVSATFKSLSATIAP
ncbi:hypothetical protein M407DRAFT_26734 [Tulasnella calospora MUT 4182]|uniref:Uncharacterized protein n=1 Tax=Tulasnella calospora MUT 4182 TaxID=1051891 RepID=A0A0C3Q4E7_9AGAM|nr:hypothetical protein M407DRAFT_26734 [Tulasnella calospora MUT 4182]